VQTLVEAKVPTGFNGICKAKKKPSISVTEGFSVVGYPKY